MFKRSAAASFALTLLILGASPAHTQELQLAPVGRDGHYIPPFFEGWYKNPDGSTTYSFGFFNRNVADTLEVPLGPDNFVEPAQFNGGQPTSFPPGRHVGVFAVTVPADYEGDVVWHVRTQGFDAQVPGRSTAAAYELSFQPMAMGSIPPEVRFERAGPVGRGPGGTYGPPLRARVGEPLQLSVWAVDKSVRQRPSTVGLTWYKHQGPGRVTFTDASEEPDAEGRGTARATFSAPGEYVIRVRADNFKAPDSDAPDQCCWTNGFVKVTVTPAAATR